MRRLVLLVLVLGAAACSFHESVQAGGDAHGDAHGNGAEAGSNGSDAAPPRDAAADAPTVCSTSGLTCLGNATAFACNGACWVQCDDPTNEFDAAGRCSGWAGELAPLRSAADETCSKFPTGASWTGYTQAVVVGEAKDENWSWNGDGQTSPYIHWANGQPNDLDGFEDFAENCAYLSTSGSWQDTSCLSLFKFSCRR